MRDVFIRFRNFVYFILLVYLGYLAFNYFSGSNEPKCGNKKVIDAVYSIINQKALPEAGMTQDDIAKLNIELSDIITLDKNSVGSYFCQATLNVKNDSKELTYLIKYNNRIIENGDGKFLTTITDIR